MSYSTKFQNRFFAILFSSISALFPGSSLICIQSIDRFHVPRAVCIIGTKYANAQFLYDLSNLFLGKNANSLLRYDFFFFAQSGILIVSAFLCGSLIDSTFKRLHNSMNN